MRQYGNDTYAAQRMNLLEKWVGVNEDFLSSVEEWERYDAFLCKRDELIARLTELDATHRYEGLAHIESGDVEKMNNLVRLIGALDVDIERSIRAQRNEVLESMRSVVKNEQLARYGYGSPVPAESEMVPTFSVKL